MMTRGHSCAMELCGGIPFTVTATDELPAHANWYCHLCHQPINEASRRFASGLGRFILPLSWLIKLPPLGDEEAIDRPRKIEEVL